MYSGRIPKELTTNRLAREARTRRESGQPLLDLTVTNPTEAGLSRLEPAAWIDAISRSSDYHPEPAGSLSARTAVAGYYADRGTAVDPDRIILTASTSEAYSFLFKLLADPGGEILAPAPSYPLFQPLAELEAVSLRSYPFHYDGHWWLDQDALGKALSAVSRALIVVEPNNPTGSVLSVNEMRMVFGLSARHRIPIIADQVFGDFMRPGQTPRPAFFAEAEAADSVSFTLSGLSKVVGLPQVKLGWIVVSGPPVEARQAIERLEWIADTFLSVGTPVQAALPALLAGRSHFQAGALARISANEDWLLKRLEGVADVGVLDRSGGWSSLIRLPRTRSEEDWCLGLLERDVLVHPGHFYDFDREAFAVVSLITPPDDFQTGMERLIDFVEGH